MLPIIIPLILIGSSVLLICLGGHLASGKVPQNPHYGFRVPLTLRSRAAWDAANIHYGLWAIVAGLVSLPIGIWILVSRPGLDGVWLYTGGLLFLLLCGIYPSLKRAQRAERRERELDAAESGMPGLDDEREQPRH